MRVGVFLSIALWIASIATAVLIVLRWLMIRRQLQDRIFADLPDLREEPAEVERGWLSSWLFKAGYRGPNAPGTFLLLTFVLGAVGLATVYFLHIPAAVAGLARVASHVPGGVGDVLLPLIYGGPWIVVAMLAAIPALVVRSARRRRVREVEEDLPIVLELLATLAKAGLGLDSAIDRVLSALPRRRVLAQELRAFQRDNLAGRPRIDSLRWLGRRVAVSWFSIFISAVVQADQIGAGLADVLQIQAEDLRQRRKEQALALASSAPIKLLLPLIVCFIPGVLTAALGPTMFEILQTLDSILHRQMR